MSDNRLVLSHLWRFLRCEYQKSRLPFLSSLVVGLLCHMYAFTNKLLNHDEVQSLFMKGGTVDSGRWGLGALDSIFPNYSMPWIYGILTLLLMAAAVSLILRILSVQSPVLQVLFSGAVMAFPSLTGTLTYMFTSNSFALSFLMAVLAVFLLKKGGIVHAAAALGCMVFSLSIYQSYISVAAGLLVVMLIRRTLQKEDILLLLRTGVGYVVFLAASLGIYYAATQVVFILKDVTFNSYAADNMGFSIAGIPDAVAVAYTSFVRFFTEGFRGLILTGLPQTLHAFCLICGGILLVLCCIRLKSLPHILLTVALVGILPLAINCMYLFTAADAVHTLVLYGFVCFYGLMAVLTEEGLLCQGTKWLSLAAANLLTIALALIVICNTYTANQVWLNLQLRYENAYGFYSTLISELHQLPEFDADSRIALIGDYREPEYYDEQFAFTRQITGSRGFMPDSYSKERFLEFYMGFPISFATEKETKALATLPQVENMSVYPYYGSIAVIDNVIVVKLSYSNS